MMNTEKRFLANYHGHTMRCGHAQGTEEAYVQEAIARGFDSIGFSDHGAWPFRGGFVSDMRMRVDQLREYCDTVLALREKYADRIRIHLGMEYESFPEFFPWLKEIKGEYGFEYFILGNHMDTNEELLPQYFGDCRTEAHLERYLEMTVLAMETGMFTYVAHPDLCLNNYPSLDAHAERVCRELCRAGKRLGIPMEYNMLGESRLPGQRERGKLGYCTPEFWQIAAEEGCTAIIGVDAHFPKAYDCVAGIEAARAKLSGMGMTVLEKLEGID